MTSAQASQMTAGFRVRNLTVRGTPRPDAGSRGRRPDRVPARREWPQAVDLSAGGARLFADGVLPAPRPVIEVS